MHAGLIRGLSSLDDDRGFKDKFLDGQMEQPAESQEAQVQLGEGQSLEGKGGVVTGADMGRGKLDADITWTRLIHCLHST